MPQLRGQVGSLEGTEKDNQPLTRRSPKRNGREAPKKLLFFWFGWFSPFQKGEYVSGSMLGVEGCINRGLETPIE